jgi:hypothetical protein
MHLHTSASFLELATEKKNNGALTASLAAVNWCTWLVVVKMIILNGTIMVYHRLIPFTVEPPPFY